MARRAIGLPGKDGLVRRASMRVEHRRRLQRALGGTALGVILCAAGCTSPWWNGFLSPHEVGNFRENRVNEIQQSISFRDKPAGIPGASDPTPEDLVAIVEEYQVGPGDGLSIRLLDFLQLGVETELSQLIDELGYIDLPQIGWMFVDKMTTRQIQAELIRQAKNAGIYPVDATPTVTVQVLSRQHRTFNISGTVQSAGEYPIIRPDLRLREAINQAGSLPDVVKTIYVFRNMERQKRIKTASMPPTARPSEAIEQDHEAPAPPVAPDSLSDMGTATGSPPATAASVPQPATRGAESGSLSLPASEVEQDLADAVAPATTPAKVKAGESAAAAPAMPTYIYVNNEFIEAPQSNVADGATQPRPEAAPPESPRAPATTTTSTAVDWEELAEEGQQRVIRIPAERIRQGDPNYNVVVRHQDWIQLDPGQTGVFYIGGHVIRAGVYALSGEEITLTQAILAAGGLDPIAWPTRCEVRRRIDNNREEITQWDLARIMAGQDPDLFLKKDDSINVGTHPVAPLLATIRNAFRLTYGFGFIYDRNFADIDSFYGQSNPKEVRRAERASRGLLN